MTQYTKLFLECLEANGSTTTVDSSPSGHPVTLNGVGTVVSSGYTKFGRNSIYFGAASGKYVSVPASDDFDFGTNDFTIDFWFKSIASSQLQTFFEVYTSYGAVLALKNTTTDKLQLLIGVSGSLLNVTGATTLSPGTEYHVALVRSGTSLKTYINGVQETSSTYSNTLPPQTYPWVELHLGYSNYYGYLTQFRISKGIARWTSNFTPPTAAYIINKLVVCPPATGSAGGDAFVTLSRWDVAAAPAATVTVGSGALKTLLTVPSGSSGSAGQATVALLVHPHPATLFLCALTGGPDALPDLPLPLSSFQAQRRAGAPSYLSVVVPDLTLAGAIADRPNGELVLRQARAAAGAIYHSEELLRVPLSDLRRAEGGRNRSLTMAGYVTEANGAPKTVALQTATYRAGEGGAVRYRLAVPEIDLRPGDTATCGADSFLVASISYSVSDQQLTYEVAS